MSDTVTPTVGRMVYFKTRGSADGVYPPTVFASIITKVHSVTKVSLATFGETGMRFEVEVEQGQEGGQWDWMPFQKDQQARLAKESSGACLNQGLAGGTSIGSTTDAPINSQTQPSVPVNTTA